MLKGELPAGFDGRKTNLVKKIAKRFQEGRMVAASREIARFPGLSGLVKSARGEIASSRLK